MIDFIRKVETWNLLHLTIIEVSINCLLVGVRGERVTNVRQNIFYLLERYGYVLGLLSKQMCT
jgi:hypothetical protein